MLQELETQLAAADAKTPNPRKRRGFLPKRRMSAAFLE
jgi:hypothetical protein